MPEEEPGGATHRRGRRAVTRAGIAQPSGVAAAGARKHSRPRRTTQPSVGSALHRRAALLRSAAHATHARLTPVGTGRAEHVERSVCPARSYIRLAWRPPLQRGRVGHVRCDVGVDLPRDSGPRPAACLRDLRDLADGALRARGTPCGAWPVSVVRGVRYGVGSLAGYVGAVERIWRVRAIYRRRPPTPAPQPPCVCDRDAGDGRRGDARAPALAGRRPAAWSRRCGARDGYGAHASGLAVARWRGRARVARAQLAAAVNPAYLRHPRAVPVGSGRGMAQGGRSRNSRALTARARCTRGTGAGRHGPCPGRRRLRDACDFLRRLHHDAAAGDRTPCRRATANGDGGRQHPTDAVFRARFHCAARRRAELRHVAGYGRGASVGRRELHPCEPTGARGDEWGHDCGSQSES